MEFSPRLDTAYKAESYRYKAKIAADIAVNEFNVELDKDTLELWEKVMVGMMHIDFVLDEATGIDGKSLFNAALLHLEYPHGVFEVGPAGFNDAVSGLVSEMYESLEYTQIAAFCSVASRLVNVSEKVKSAATRHEFTFWTRLEGQLSARALLIATPRYVAEQQAFRDFSKALFSLNVFYNCFDNFNDLPDDFEHGVVDLRPTLSNRLAILFSGRVDLYRSVRRLGINSVAKLGRYVLLSNEKKRALHEAALNT